MKKKVVKKSEIWESPRMEDLHNGKRSYELCFFIKMIYNACQNTNGNKSPRRYRRFIHNVKTFALEADEKVLNFRQRYISKLVDSIPDEFYKPKLIDALNIPKYILENIVDSDTDLFSYEEMAERRVDYAKVDGIEGDSLAISLGGKEERMLYPSNIEDIKKGDYIVFDRGNPYNKVLICKNLKEVGLAKRKVIKNCIDEINLSYKCEGNLSLVKKNNHIKDISTDKLKKDFMFREVSIPFDLSKKERISLLCNLYEAFDEFCSILKCSRNSVSFKGRIGLDIRKGLKGDICALCDTESNNLILDIDSGAGNIAHEWFHYLDHVLSGSDEAATFASSSMNNDAIEDLLFSLKYNKYGKLTKFFKESELMDNNSNERWGDNDYYWASECEMLARAFAIYFRDRNRKSSAFLTRKRELKTVEPSFTESEKKSVYEGFDRLLKYCFRNHILLRAV